MLYFHADSGTFCVSGLKRFSPGNPKQELRQLQNLQFACRSGACAITHDNPTSDSATRVAPTLQIIQPVLLLVATYSQVFALWSWLVQSP
jgi:hypothetical protein